MTAVLKATSGVDSRWIQCLQRHFPFQDAELGDHLLTTLAYVASGAPQMWTETESKGAKGCKTSPIECFHTVQKRFDRHQGELAAVLCIYKAWEKVPKRERLRWCRRNHVNNAGLSQVQDALIRLKSELQKMGRRKSLRSAEGNGAEIEETVLARLAALLMKVFADCCYLRWHTGQTYLNLVTSASRMVDFGDLGLFEAFNVNLPTYILYLPNVTSRSQEDDFNPATEVCVSLVVPDNVAQNAINSVALLMKNQQKFQSQSPVPVRLPLMGDAVVLQLVGTLSAQEELRQDIYKSCSKDDMLLAIKVHEPSVAGSRWKMEIHCPEMYQKQIEGLLAEKVRYAMDRLETEIELLPFPDLDSNLRLVVGGGEQVQEVESTQHPVLVYFIKTEDKQRDNTKNSATHEDLTEDLVRVTMERFGKIAEVEKSRQFLEETLWGTVRFEHLSSARKAGAEANGVILLDKFQMKVVHIESDCQLYKLGFRWRRSTLVRNKLHMYFLNEEDLNRFKRQKMHDELKREYDDDELKATITTDDTYSNLPDHTSMLNLSVYPKFTTYNHHVIYEACEADINNVRTQLKERLAESFSDPDLIDINFEIPKPGAAILTGRFGSCSLHRLMRLEDHIGYYEGSSLLAGGEMATDRRVHMNFTLPAEAFKKLEPEFKAIYTKQRYARSDSEESGEQLNGLSYKTEPVVGRKEDLSQSTGQPEGELLNVTVYGNQFFYKVGSELKAVTKLMKPHIMHVRGELLAALLAPNQQKEPNIYQIMKDTNTFIQVIKRSSLLRIYGPQKSVTEAVARIRNFLVDRQKSRTPQKSGGSRQGRKKRVSQPPSLVPEDCSVCLCEAQTPTFHLSLCGHPYCHQCFRDLTISCKSSRSFPIRCVKEDCNRVVLNADIEQVCSDFELSLTNLLTASMQAFQRNNIMSVHPCITPDCEMVYRMCATRQEGLMRSFTCPLCQVNLCTHCHCAYHVGLSCSVFKAMETVDNKVKAWMEEDKEFRKLCPNCKTGIEKVDGCDHLHCTACKAEICWLCLQFFNDPRRMSYHRCTGEDTASDGGDSDNELE